MSVARNNASLPESAYGYQAETAYDYPAESAYTAENGQADGRKLSARPTAAGKRLRRRAATRPPAALITGVLVFATLIFAIAIVSVNTVFIENKSDAMKLEVDKLSEANALLQIEIDKLSSVERIEQAALALGMVRPVNKMYIPSDLIHTPEAAGESAAGFAPAAAGEDAAAEAGVEVETAAVNSDGPFRGIIRAFAGFFAYARG
ncbi:MAG: hypothetical protein LBH21_06235 [Gracilibacteraceae bacterium]|nr:hypothetical protein [Gracilibacteraceae bacterium]